MVTAIFYNIFDRENVLDKNLDVSRETINGLLFGGFKNIYPNLKIKATENFKYNYCYIEDLNKYYFVKNINRIDNNYLMIDLKLDVLQTYKDIILNCSGLVVSRENANNFISNRENIKNLIPQYKKILFPNEIFSTEKENIILIAIKGDK